jgi:ribosome-binding protein aMBF1 (putative translation factor)
VFEDPDMMTSDSTADGGNKRSNPPRLITPQELAMLCKFQRQARGWSQETLADIARVVERGH